jgi:RNA polymerase sigma-70 factor, ECF subfamily
MDRKLPVLSRLEVAGESDASLVGSARAGARWAREGLFRRHMRLVLGLSQRILGNRQGADDVAQDALVEALRRLDSLANPQAFASWISTIVVRTAIRHLRRRRLLVHLGFAAKDPIEPDTLVAQDAPPEAAVELRQLYGVLGGLSTEQRVALVLRRVEGQELSEIAEHMGLSLATTKRRIEAADRRLLQLLGQPAEAHP